MAAFNSVASGSAVTTAVGASRAARRRRSQVAPFQTTSLPWLSAGTCATASVTAKSVNGWPSVVSSSIRAPFTAGCNCQVAIPLSCSGRAFVDVVEPVQHRSRLKWDRSPGVDSVPAFATRASGAGGPGCHSARTRPAQTPGAARPARSGGRGIRVVGYYDAAYDRIRTWRSNGSGDGVAADALGTCTEVAAVDRIPIAEQMARLGAQGVASISCRHTQAAVGLAVTFTCSSWRQPCAMNTST
jgi:hypothetical protein